MMPLSLCKQILSLSWRWFCRCRASGLPTLGKVSFFSLSFNGAADIFRSGSVGGLVAVLSDGTLFSLHFNCATFRASPSRSLCFAHSLSAHSVFGEASTFRALTKSRKHFSTSLNVKPTECPFPITFNEDVSYTQKTSKNQVLPPSRQIHGMPFFRYASMTHQT